MRFGPCHGEESARRGRNAIDQMQTRRRLRSEGRRNLLGSADGRNLPGQVVNFGWTASHTSSQRAADWGLPPSCLLFTSPFVFSQKRSHEVADEPKASGKELERFSTRVLSIFLIRTLRHYSFIDCGLTGRWRTPYSPEGVGARSRRHRNRRKLALCICPSHFPAALVVESVLFPDALSDLFQPCSRVCAVNDASQESELRDDVVAVLSNVVFCSFGVQGKEALHAPWLCEYVSGVAQLRSFDDHCLFYIEDVFVAK